MIYKMQKQTYCYICQLSFNDSEYSMHIQTEKHLILEGLRPRWYLATNPVPQPSKKEIETKISNSAEKISAINFKKPFPHEDVKNSLPLKRRKRYIRTNSVSAYDFETNEMQDYFNFQLDDGIRQSLANFKKKKEEEKQTKINEE